jgi:hypothetical protein
MRVKNKAMAEREVVSTKLAVTPVMMQALAKISEYCGREFAVTPVSHTITRQLAKLGWVETRVTKVHGVRVDAEQKTHIYRVRMTRAGEGALVATVPGPALPALFDCGCSRLKVTAGMCDVYFANGEVRT